MLRVSKVYSVCIQVNSAKSVDKDYKALKAKLSDDGVIEKSLEAKLLERQGKGIDSPLHASSLWRSCEL